MGRDNHCYQCDRTFKNANALKQHRNSSIHRLRNVKCPFEHLGCTSKGFISVAALTRHFDAGGCTFITRRRFNGIAYDLNQDSNRAPYSVIVPDVNPRTMGISKHKVYLITKEAGGKVLNGEVAWTCTHPGCGAKFNDKDSLKAHLKSPTHEARMYQCPGCDARFPDLGSACSHIYQRVRGCDVNVRAVTREVRELITAITTKQNPRARSL